VGNSKFIWLSHILSENTPSYGGENGISIMTKTSIKLNDTANSLRLSLNSHMGTHIDVPKHFFDDGFTITDIDASFWVFNSPQLIDHSCRDGELIKVADVEGKLNYDTDLLLIRTGFESHRKSSRYWKKNPGISPNFARFLRNDFPNIRAIGVDSISITSWMHRKTGKEAHTEFLNPEYPGSPILIIEDMSLAIIKDNLKSVIVLPLRIENADGAPVTIIGYS